MSGEFRIDYNAVFESTSAFQAQIDSAIRQMEEGYRQLGPLLSESDGRANAAMKEAINSNQKKAYTTAMTLRKLLSFMSNSALKAQETDMAIERIFQGSKMQV